ncbi:ADP-ribosylglycohydrolase family protein [Paenibacillus thermotolerans]|uniref:ADP-ribosylglycohydrolase family protein n=1 Tax=Paenibacillus thermotolerans TaxID=3027807 RepID=UPI002368CEA4|nr:MULTISPECIES: ADP-ribosylglycohydrolase family protein [unclassified Paenibacillus]
MNLIDYQGILQDELVQLKEEGRDTEALEKMIAEAGALTDPEAAKRVAVKHYENMLSGNAPMRKADFRYIEPNDLESIQAESAGREQSAAARGPTGETLNDKIYGAWLARSAGCLLGKPVEGWPREYIRSLLQQNGGYPLTHYFTGRYKPVGVENWMAEEYEQNAIELCKAMPRDDDMDYTILALKTLETFGGEFTTENVGTMWLHNLPPLMTYTAERAAYLNLCAGIGVPQAAVYMNPYREWIGAQIRTDLYGYVNPGNPAAAAAMAYRDAALSHTGNGVYGAMFIAAMNAAAFTESDIGSIIRAGMSVIPKRSRLYEAIEWVLMVHAEEPDWEKAGDRLHEKFGCYHRVHTINNAAIVAHALLYGEGDLERTITIAVMLGLDTDCNGASAGSVIGAIAGAASLPEKWIKPLHDQIESYIAGEGVPHISKLASRTAKRVKA